jgi:hypothetical protein
MGRAVVVGKSREQTQQSLRLTIGVGLLVYLARAKIIDLHVLPRLLRDTSRNGQFCTFAVNGLCVDDGEILSHGFRKGIVLPGEHFERGLLLRNA